MLGSITPTLETVVQPDGALTFLRTKQQPDMQRKAAAIRLSRVELEALAAGGGSIAHHVSVELGLCV